MRFVAKEDICPEIFEGDEVILVPDDQYMIGTNIKIKDYFGVKPGDVVVSKMSYIENSEQGNIALAKCKRNKLVKLNK